MTLAQEIIEDQTLTELDLFKELDEVTSQIQIAQNKLEALEEILRNRRKRLETLVKDTADRTRWSRFKPEHLQSFIEEPYIIEPSRINKAGKVLEWRVYVPKMVEFQVGRLERATHSYNVFSVNQYMRWFAEIPKEIESRFTAPDLDLKVNNGLLITKETDYERVWSRYRKHLVRREGPGAMLIKKGSEWGLIAQILEDGCLPFTPEPVHREHLRERSVHGFALNPGWKMRDYQMEAFNLFLDYGAIGVYWPFGTGKSQLGVELCDRLKGQKLVIAGGSSSLREQWEQRLSELPTERREECHVVLYQSSSQINKLIKGHKEFMLVIYDEVHHLPSRTFMRLATIPTKYRLGLTGSPYREDGHINYILALTGMPHGLAWSKFVSKGIISLAQVQVHVVKKQRDKLLILDSLLQRDLGKTLIYSDGLDLGKIISTKYGIPFIHGATVNRIEKIENNKRVVISRVGDEGISIPEIDTVIEVDFLGGSRMQALQRVGRLQHRLLEPEQEPAVHHILMTEEEVERYGKRVLAYYDKGFKVDWLYGF
jgi:DNA excision repair protein ERCC-3